MLRDIYYENFDGKCYVNVRIMKTSPLYGVSSDILPLFLGGKVKIFSSNQPKNAPPSIAMDKTFFEKWKLSEENKSASKSTKWYFSFTCNDRFEADKVIDQIHELEGMESEERNFLLFNTQLLYVHTHTNDDYLRAVSEMTVSLDMDAPQTSKFAMKLICSDKKKRTLNKLFGKSQYENFAVKLLASDSSEVIVTMKKGKFLWSYLKYTNQFGKVIERER